MKKTFTKEYIIDNKGCYSLAEVEAIKCINDKRITLKNLFDNLPVKDFTWFLVRKCDLTLKQKRQFALHCAKQVLPIFEKKYPEDKKVRECIEATQLYVDGKITREELLIKRRAAAAYAAYTADAAAYATAYAAYAAAYAAYTADDDAATAAAAYAAYTAAAAYAAYTAAAAYAAYTATAAAAYAAYADAYAADAYKQYIWEFVKTLK